jgi:hypothetical protein
VRQYLHERLGRGYEGDKGKGKGKGKSGGKHGSSGEFARKLDYKPTQEILGRTKCARCGEKGHWARTCTNPADARGRVREQYKSHTFLTCTSFAPSPQLVMPSGFVFACADSDSKKLSPGYFS